VPPTEVDGGPTAAMEGDQVVLGWSAPNRP
jgi:hypothetical protein